MPCFTFETGGAGSRTLSRDTSVPALSRTTMPTATIPAPLALTTIVSVRSDRAGTDCVTRGAEMDAALRMKIETGLAAPGCLLPSIAEALIVTRLRPGAFDGIVAAVLTTRSRDVPGNDR